MAATGFIVTDPTTGRKVRRHALERPTDGFVMVQCCDCSHVYAISRADLWAGEGRN